MNVLLLAPQPFYTERGTPIAVRLLAETLCSAGYYVDLLTFHEGEDVSIPGLRIERIPKLPFVKNVPVGFSFKKLCCDLLLAAKLYQLLWKRHYDFIHAVEESVFPVLLTKLFISTPIIYDMDSSMADQMIEKWPLLRYARKVLYGFEKLAARIPDAVFAVCDDLAEKIKGYAPKQTVYVIEDTSPRPATALHGYDKLRPLLDIKGKLVLYVGNLEHYQGVDLMIQGFAQTQKTLELDLVIIGGPSGQIQCYRQMARDLGIGDRTHLLGTRPVDHLSAYLEQADILVSPRLKGANTPMKLFSYLAAGKPILATNIRSHTQVLNASSAFLVDPTPAAMAQGFSRLSQDRALCSLLGSAAYELSQQRYSQAAFQRKVLDSYASLQPKQQTCSGK
ncbi:MAG: glycosyltransferase family 4 protein [Gammaproteobacteria bacterium]